MKTFFRITVLALLGCLLTGCGSMGSTRTAQNTSSMERPVRLQMTVDLPPSMSILRDDYVSEAFADRISAALHEHGLRGRIRYVEFGDSALPDVPVLEVMRREWRVDRIGNVGSDLLIPGGEPSNSVELS